MLRAGGRCCQVSHQIHFVVSIGDNQVVQRRELSYSVSVWAFYVLLTSFEEHLQEIFQMHGQFLWILISPLPIS